MPPRAIIYARYSPRRKANGDQSIDQQLDEARAYAAREGLSVASEHCDRAFSGNNADRPGLWDAIDALTRGDIILVTRLDRLSRDVYLSELIDQAVKKRGGSVISIAGEGTWSDVDSPADKLQRQVMQAFAEYERALIRIRTSLAMRRHLKNGIQMSSQSPYGWTIDPDAVPDERGFKHMLPNPAEQATVDRIVALYKAGMGTVLICDTLHKSGTPSRGKRWLPIKLFRILRRAGVTIRPKPGAG